MDISKVGSIFMTRNKIKSLALLFSSILLVSCGKNVGDQVIIENSNASESNESSSDATETTGEVTENVDEVVEEQEEGNIFYDFSKWGSKEPGKFSAVFIEKKDR